MQNDFLRVKFGADTQELDIAIRRIEGKMQVFGNQLSQIGNNMKLTITAPILALATKMVYTASKAEETSSKFDAVFKDLAQETREWSGQSAEAFNRSQISMESYLAQLQDTFVPMGVARKQAAELSKQVVTLGIDLAAFNNKADDEVINNLTSALVGNSEAVRSYGISLTEASLNQELANMGFEGGTRKADELTKMMARLNIMMQSTTDAQGDAERTSESFANQLKALEGDVEQLNVAFGELLVESIKPMIPELQELIDSFTELDDSTKYQVISVGALSAGVGILAVALGKIISSFGIIIQFAKANPWSAVAISMVGLLAKLGVTEVGFRSLIKRIDDFKENTEDTDLKEFNSAIDEAKVKLAELRIGAMKVNDPIGQISYWFHKATGSIKRFEDEIRDAERNAGIIRYEQLNKALEDASWEDIGDLIKEINSEIDIFKGKIGDVDAGGLSDIVLALTNLYNRALKVAGLIGVQKPKVPVTQTAPETVSDDVLFGGLEGVKSLEELNREEDKAVGLLNEAQMVLEFLEEQQRRAFDPKVIREYGREIERVLMTINLLRGTSQPISEGSLPMKEIAIQGLRQAQQMATTNEEYEKFAEQIQFIQSGIDQIKGIDNKQSEQLIPEGSVRALEQQLRSLYQAQSLTTDAEAWQGYKEQIDAVKDSIREITGEGEQMVQKFNTFQVALESMGEIIASAFTDAIIQGKELTDVLKNLGKYILSSGIRFILSTLLSGGLSGGGFFGEGGGIFGNIFGSIFKSPVTEAVASTASTMGMESLFVPSALNDAGELNVVVRGQLKGQDIFLSNERGGQSYDR